jgi:hypothetical protein
MPEFASKGVAGSGLGLGIAGTALGLLNNGAGGILGWGNNYNYGCGVRPVSQFELAQAEKISALESAVALRDANVYGDQKLLDLYKYFDGELKDIRKTMCETNLAQSVINAKFESGLDVLGTQVASINNTLCKLTKTVIPNAALCPGWGDVTVSITPATTPTT